MPAKRNMRSLLPLPTVINPAQRRCVTFNIPDDLIHIGNFWGIIEKLGQWNAYSEDTAKTGKEIAAVWREVIADARVRWLDNDCGGAPEAGECFDYDTASGVITYEPINPYTEAGEVPSGYANTPLRVVTADDTALLLLGFLPGDIETDLASFPVGSLPTVIPPDGLPRFRVTFNGNDDPEGMSVEIHFIKIPAGGRMLVTVDGQVLDPLPEFVELNRDLLAVPPETSIEVVIEKKIIGTGQHFIDCTFLPSVNDEVPYLYFGGGLRKVVICGEDISTPVPQMTFDNCVLSFRPSASSAWQTFDLSACIRSLIDEEIAERLEDGELGGTQSPPQGTISPYFCKSFHVTLNANQRWLCPIPIKANYRITVTNAQGGASDGTINWYCPQSTLFGLGSCGSVEQAAQGSDPLQTQGHMRLIMAYDGTYYDAFNVDNHTVSPSLSGEKQLEFQVNDSPIADNSGSYQFDLEICNFGECAPVFGPTDKVTVSYNNDEITVQAHTSNPDANGAYQLFATIADADGTPCPCRALQIISLTGYQLPGDPHNFNGGSVTPCEMSIIVNEKITGQNWQTFYNGLTDAQKCIYTFDIKSVTPFTITFKIVDCP